MCVFLDSSIHLNGSFISSSFLFYRVWNSESYVYSIPSPIFETGNPVYLKWSTYSLWSMALIQSKAGLNIVTSGVKSSMIYLSINEPCKGEAMNKIPFKHFLSCRQSTTIYRATTPPSEYAITTNGLSSSSYACCKSTAIESANSSTDQSGTL